MRISGFFCSSLFLSYQLAWVIHYMQRNQQGVVPKVHLSLLSSHTNNQSSTNYSHKKSQCHAESFFEDQSVGKGWERLLINEILTPAQRQGFQPTKLLKDSGWMMFLMKALLGKVLTFSFLSEQPYLAKKSKKN